MADPITTAFAAFAVAEICITGLRYAVKGLKGLFKWIRRWLARKLKLPQYIAMLDADCALRTKELADKLLVSPEAFQRAQRYAEAVSNHSRLEVAQPRVREEDHVSDYETGSEWDGESCAGSEVPDTDYELEDSTDEDSSGVEDGNGQEEDDTSDDEDDGQDGEDDEQDDEDNEQDDEDSE